MNKKELMNLLKEEYNKRLNVFSNLGEVTTEYDGKVIIGAETKLRSISGDLYTVVDGKVILNDDGEKCLKLKKENTDNEKNYSIDVTEDNPLTNDNIHPKKNNQKVSFEIDINKPNTLEGEMPGNYYLVTLKNVEDMFTL